MGGGGGSIQGAPLGASGRAVMSGGRESGQEPMGLGQGTRGTVLGRQSAEPRLRARVPARPARLCVCVDSCLWRFVASSGSQGTCEDRGQGQLLGPPPSST